MRIKTEITFDLELEIPNSDDCTVNKLEINLDSEKGTVIFFLNGKNLGDIEVINFYQEMKQMQKLLKAELE